MRSFSVPDPETVLRPAMVEGRTLLFEDEGFSLCEGLGITTPHRVYLPSAIALDDIDLAAFPGDRVVVKVAAPEIAHKTEVGGVRTCPRRTDELSRVISEMADRFPGCEIAIHEFVPYDPSPGGELLLGVRNTPDHGPVATLGLGGIEAERLAVWEPLCIGSHGLYRKRLEEALVGHPLAMALTEPYRGRPARLEMTVLENLLGGLLTLAGETVPRLAEFEINPLVVVRGDLVALDVLVRLETNCAQTPQVRPLHKLHNLLRPESIAIAGVSRRQNPGRVILDNVLAEGFPSERVTVLKPGVDQVAGCRAVASIGDLEAPVDLLVLAVSAEAVPDLVEQAVRDRKAESIVLIPGGLGERGGSETHVERIRETLATSRASDWQGPVMNGANCLGVRSVPGRYDTLFIPRHKLSFPARKSTPLALISQSGAFAVARASKLWSLSPRYVVSVGNQIDLTVGDYLTFLADDSEVEVFACYVEGFRPLDGARFLAAAERIVASGRTVVLYRAGRSAAGMEAAVSHTAAVAGAYPVTRQLADQSGVLVAETIGEFEELTRVACLLAGRDVAGGRLGAMSNAGFESVAIADRLGRLQLVEYSTVTRARLGELIARHRLEKIVAIDNPLDTSPIFDDDSFVEAARAIVEDERVDVAVIGCVPLTPAMQTLVADAGHLEDVEADGSVASGLIRLWQQTKKPLVVVIDGGPMYEPFARRLEAEGVPTFRTADRALEVLNSCLARRLERQ